MKYLLSFSLLLVVRLAACAQLVDLEAFFEGDYDKDYIRTKKIKTISVNFFIKDKKTLIQFFEFDNKGILRSCKVTDSIGKNTNTYLFEYYQYGNKKEYTHIDHEIGEKQTMHFTNIYEGSVLISQQSKELFSITKFAYNLKGQKTSVKKILGLDTALAGKMISDYDYDQRGKLKSITTKFVDNYGHINSKRKELFIYNNEGKLQYIKREEDPTYLITFDQKGLLKSRKQKVPEDLGGFEIADEYQYSFWK
ncbi:hypothetical protein [Pedobacter sp.]